MSTKGGVKAIVAALAANSAIAVAKFVGFVVTGSSSMLAESVHSVADTANQGLLLLGQDLSRKAANYQHPFGHGRNRYFYSFVVALLLFTLGSVFAFYEGIHKLETREPLDYPLVAVAILLIATILETLSFRTALAESRPVKDGDTWWHFIRQAKAPELPIVILEDAGALCGLAFALAGVILTLVMGDPIWDGVGTLAIGALLGVIATFLIIKTKSLLIGEGATPDELHRITEALLGGAIRRVIHLRTQYLSPEELLIVAKVAVPPALSTRDIALAIDEAEARVRAEVPAVRLVYLEPDLDRSVK